MAARYSYSNTPYQVDELAMYQYQYRQQMEAMQSGPRRFVSAVGRFFYRLIVLCLILGAVGGVLFALYRNDILLTISRGAGFEAQYRSLEQRVGAPGWGTPRSIDLPKEAPASAPLAVSPAAATGAEEAPARQPETVHAAATSETKRATAEGLPILSFDSLPTAPTKKAARETISLSALPAAAPVKAARAEPAPAPAPARQHRARAEKPEPAKPVALQRSIPLPKPKAEPEPVAKAEPPPKPEPPAPKAPEPDPTTPRASDNPLKAAIRAAMTKK